MGRVSAWWRRLLDYCVVLRKIQGIALYRRVARSFRSGLEIKEADEEDLRELHAWLNPGGAQAPVSRTANTTNFVAQKGAKLVGFIQLVRRPEGGYPYLGHWLYSLKVRALYRGMGIGEELSRAVIEKAREEGAEEISLLVDENNERAIKLYRKLGFEMKVIPALREQLEKRGHSLGYRKVVMSKSLAGEDLNSGQRLAAVSYQPSSER